jgi:hypothetical protein
MLPEVRRVKSRLAIMPIDPVSGGTWIGANDAGLVCTLLNVYDGLPIGAAAPVSRGTIIPPLLGCSSIDQAFDRCRELRPQAFLPFRLLITSGLELLECWTDRQALHYHRQPLTNAVMRTSSSLGERRVGRPRTMLFRRILAASSHPIGAQHLFHLHRWRRREDISVRMRRADAQTVSYTIVEVGERGVRLSYRPAYSTLRLTPVRVWLKPDTTVSVRLKPDTAAMNEVSRTVAA